MMTDVAAISTNRRQDVLGLMAFLLAPALTVRREFPRAGDRHGWPIPAADQARVQSVGLGIRAGVVDPVFRPPTTRLGAG